MVLDLRTKHPKNQIINTQLLIEAKHEASTAYSVSLPILENIPLQTPRNAE